MAYQTKNYEEQGGAVLVIGGELRIASGAQVTAAGTQAATQPTGGIAITWSSGNPNITPNGALTISNGATPTVAELQEFCVELNDQVAKLIAALKGAGIVATA